MRVRVAGGLKPAGMVLAAGLMLASCSGSEDSAQEAPEVATPSEVSTTPPTKSTAEGSSLPTEAPADTSSPDRATATSATDPPPTTEASTTTASTTTAAPATTVPPDSGHRGLVWESGVDASRVNVTPTEVPRPTWSNFFTTVELDMLLVIDAQTNPTSELAQECHEAARVAQVFNPPNCLMVQFRAEALGQATVGAEAPTVSIDEFLTSDGRFVDMYAFDPFPYLGNPFLEVHRGGGDQITALVFPNVPAGGEMQLNFFGECSSDFSACNSEEFTIILPGADQLRPISFT